MHFYIPNNKTTHRQHKLAEKLRYENGLRVQNRFVLEKKKLKGE